MDATRSVGAHAERLIYCSRLAVTSVQRHSKVRVEVSLFGVGRKKVLNPPSEAPLNLRLGRRTILVPAVSPLRRVCSLLKPVCESHHTPAITKSTFHAVKDTTGFRSSSVSTESRSTVASQLAPSCLLIVLCILIATHVTYFSIRVG